MSDRREWKRRVCQYLASCLDAAPDWMDPKSEADEERMFDAMKEVLEEMRRRAGMRP